MTGYTLTVRIIERKYLDHALLEAGRGVLLQIGLHLTRGPLAPLPEENAHSLLSTPTCPSHLKVHKLNLQ